MLVRRVHSRVLTWLSRHGYLREKDDSAEGVEASPLAACARMALQGGRFETLGERGEPVQELTTPARRCRTSTCQDRLLVFRLDP